LQQTDSRKYKKSAPSWSEKSDYSPAWHRQHQQDISSAPQDSEQHDGSLYEKQQQSNKKTIKEKRTTTTGHKAEPVNQCRKPSPFYSKMRIHRSTDVNHFKRNVLTLSIAIEPQNKPLAPPRFLLQRPLDIFFVLGLTTQTNCNGKLNAHIHREIETNAVLRCEPRGRICGQGRGRDRRGYTRATCGNARRTRAP